MALYSTVRCDGCGTYAPPHATDSAADLSAEQDAGFTLRVPFTDKRTADLCRDCAKDAKAVLARLALPVVASSNLEVY